MIRSETGARRGFSRADLAVVVALGLCLLGLLTPALQGARQKAAREKTVNNLKFIALAMHSHNDTFKRLPPAYGKLPPFSINLIILSCPNGI